MLQNFIAFNCMSFPLYTLLSISFYILKNNVCKTKDLKTWLSLKTISYHDLLLCKFLKLDINPVGYSINQSMLK